ncbi:MAG: NAD(P)H-binding protein, partial [Candidatus Gracilibacteria bacterium]
VGRHLIKRLEELRLRSLRLREREEYDITCLVRKTSNISHLASAALVYGDITNLDDVINASKNKDIIINLAVPNTQNLEINRQIIVEGAKNIIKAARKNAVPKIIALSSFAGYRKNLDNYGKAKKEADEIYKEIYKNEAGNSSNLNLILLRPTMIYGKGGYAFGKLLASITKIPFLTFIVGNGKNKIQPAFIGDVVDAIIASIEYEADSRNHQVETFDLGGPVPIKYDDFVKIIQGILKKRKILIHIPLPLLVGLAKFLKIFIKNAAWNDLTFKRIVEEVDLDTKKTEESLGLRLTDYETGLETILLSGISKLYK